MTDNNTLTLPLHENVSRSRDTVEATVAATGAQKRPPLFVPRDQLYYWTREWQEGEAEALHELQEGEFRSFPDGTTAAGWLLSDDEE
jgi:hypothetical protein